MGMQAGWPILSTLFRDFFAMDPKLPFVDVEGDTNVYPLRICTFLLTLLRY
jgi:hypothetical protein